VHGGRAHDRKPRGHVLRMMVNTWVTIERWFVWASLDKPAKSKMKRSKVHIDRRAVWSTVVGGQDEAEMQGPRRQRAIVGRGRQQVVALMVVQVLARPMSADDRC
jgi:hypothetical protein